MSIDVGKPIFCVLCGTPHDPGTACDPDRLEWVRVRRAEVARGVPWCQATPMPKAAVTMQTIIVVTETPTASYTDEFEIKADATDDEIQDEAQVCFDNRCSWGWHRKESDDTE